MAIFSRRTIQRLINENSKFLKSKQTKKHVNKLNLKEHIQKLNEGNNTNELIRDYLNTEWEIVSLNVFSKFGTVIHEPKLEKSRKKIDVLFTSTEHNFEFLGDITCITGKQDKHNILLQFKREFEKIIDRNDLIGFWRIRPGRNNREVGFRKWSPKIKLVGEQQFESEIFNTTGFCKFIEGIKNSPERKHSYCQITENENIQHSKLNETTLYQNEIINLVIDYEPSKYHQIHFSQFDDKRIIDIYENKIYRSLEGKHDEQLSETGYQGHLGIILCEGIDNIFNQGDLIYKSSRDVINSFLCDHPKISFVLTVTSTKNLYTYNLEPSIIIEFYEGESDNKLSEKAIKMLKEDLVKEFPKPARTAEEARQVLEVAFENKETVFSADYCGISISSSEIRVSAKKMLELLSGKLSWEKVFYHLGFERVIGSSLPNTFLEMLSEGKLISDVGIEKRGFEIDDDWLVFKFDEQDPAISPFKVPDTNK